MPWYGPSSSMSVPDRKREEERLAQAQKFAADKVEFYIDQYKKQFAFEVYGWWIEHGEPQYLRGYMERPRTSDRYGAQLVHAATHLYWVSREVFRGPRPRSFELVTSDWQRKVGSCCGYIDEYGGGTICCCD